MSKESVRRTSEGGIGGKKGVSESQASQLGGNNRQLTLNLIRHASPVLVSGLCCLAHLALLLFRPLNFP
jgi:hypothetical protein